MKDLKETIVLMTSDDWKDRLVAEYWQTKIRYERLHKRLVEHDAGVIDLTPNKEYPMRKQESLMDQYLYQIEIRAAQEGINLDV